MEESHERARIIALASPVPSGRGRGAMGAHSEALLVLTTAPDLKVARRLARTLVEARLVACASLMPGLESHYRWKGTTESSSEVQLLLKTTRERLPDLEAALGEAHPYEVPELLALPVVGGGGAYLDWLRESVSDARDTQAEGEA